MRIVSRDQILRYTASIVTLVVIVFVFRRLVRVNPTTVALSFLLAILLASAAWGLKVSVFMSVLATLAFNYYFLPPIGTFTIADPQNWMALFAFLLTAITANHISERARREAQGAIRRRREIERLYAFTQKLLVTGNVVELLNTIPRHIVESFEVNNAAVFLASKDVIYRFGHDSQDLDSDSLKTVAARGEPVVQADRKISLMPVRMGVRLVGSVGVSGGSLLTRETLEAMGTLIAIAMERASAVEALGKAEAARQEERLRTALLDSVTHELRTPLTSIKASTTSLLSHPQLGEAERLELLSVIDEECDRLNRLIEEALEMARLDAGEVELKLEPHLIREVIEAALEQCKHELEKHSVEVKLSDHLPTVKMDSDHIKEVLAHLLENAAKYSAPRTPIYIRSEVSGPFLVTSVADHGAGIDSFEQALIFDKFYRGKDQRYRVQGTGMGLAICKAIVEAHGGTIGVTSQVEQGSVFHFSLPISSPEAA